MTRSTDTHSAVIATGTDIARGLRALGVEAGDIVCVHSSMNSLGLVIGGPRTIVEALVEAVSPDGTVMMPTYSGDMSDPAEWRYPSVPADQLDEIRAQMPAYDPARTPTRGLGQVAEYFRTYPDVVRSPHPQSSFAALGVRAMELVSDHPYENRFGPQSPLGRLCDAGGKVLLLGAPHDTVSLFHMIQHLVGESTVVQKTAPVIDLGARRWVTYSDIDYPIDWFKAGVTALIEAGIASTGSVRAAPSVLFPATEAVTFLVNWRHEHGFIPSIAEPQHTDRNN